MEDLELNDTDRAEIARLIKDGATSGILDSEDEDGNPTRIDWGLNTNKFNQ